MKEIFYPNSVAVIGVSEKPDNLAAEILRNLRRFDFSGDVYAVGRRAGEVEGMPILPSIDALPSDVDLAVILTPATTVPGLLEACGRSGIHHAVIESGGFTEFSADGRVLEEELTAVARRWGIKFVGPNCISVINMENGLCLPFARLGAEGAKEGPVSVLAQSGGVSITYLILLSEAGLGANKIVSMGNKADLDEVDYLSYLLEDSGTEIICLYLESIENGRELLESASRSSKPIIVQKANRSDASAEIAFSHTAALANDDAIVDAALRQAGVVRADSFDDAVAVAQGLTLPPVTGDDLLIISRSGGHAVVAADAAEAHGFRLIPIPEALADRVRELFRADVIAPTNPLDLGAIFDFELYGQVVEECLRALDPHAILLIHTYSPGAESSTSERLARRLGSLAGDLGRPLALCAFAQHEQIVGLREATTLPVFTEIEAAVRALAASRLRAIHSGKVLPLDPAPQERPDKVDALLADSGVLTTDHALDLCGAFGIPCAEWAVVPDEESAVVAADILGYPVALKGLASATSHKSRSGLVALDIRSVDQLRAGFEEITHALDRETSEDEPMRIMVQTMVSGGLEVIVGGKRDPSFGPVVIFGLGGTDVEAVRDVVFRLAPLRPEEARRMMDEIRARHLLSGGHDRPPVDREAVVRALLSMSDLLIACPEVVEIEVNPLAAFEAGAAALDARALVGGQTA